MGEGREVGAEMKHPGLRLRPPRLLFDPPRDGALCPHARGLRRGRPPGWRSARRTLWLPRRARIYLGSQVTFDGAAPGSPSARRTLTWRRPGHVGRVRREIGAEMLRARRLMPHATDSAVRRPRNIASARPTFSRPRRREISWSPELLLGGAAAEIVSARQRAGWRRAKKATHARRPRSNNQLLWRPRQNRAAREPGDLAIELGDVRTLEGPLAEPTSWWCSGR